MTRLPVLVAAAIAWTCLVAVPFSQSQSPTASAVSGLVVNDAGAPVGRALLALTSPDLPGPRTVISEDDGRFVFADLPPGRFRLLASKPFHRDAEFGQRVEGDLPTQIRLTEGQHLSDLRQTLPRLSSIRGGFVDAAGRPMLVMRYADRSSGPEIRRLRDGRPTADRFSFSLDGRGGFHVPRLNAGVYELRGSPGSPAIHVTLGAGEQRTDVLLPMTAADEPPRIGHIDGLVLDLSGAPMKDVQFRLVSLDRDPADDVYLPGSPRADDHGRFALKEIPVGRYMLFARAAIFSGTGGASTFRSFWASTEVVVTPDGGYAPLTLRPGVIVGGQVVFSGSTLPTPSHSNVSVSLVPQDGRAALSAEMPGNVPGGQVSADGSFFIWSVPPGKYTVSVRAYDRLRNVGEGWNIESAVLNGVDVQDVMLTVGDTDVAGLQVRLTDQTASLTGTVRDETDTFAYDATVIAFPVERAAWRPGARRIRAVRPDTSGTFEISGLSPGEYYVSAVRDIGPDDWFDPQVLAALRETATRVTIGEPGRQKPITLHLR